MSCVQCLGMRCAPEVPNVLADLDSALVTEPPGGAVSRTRVIVGAVVVIAAAAAVAVALAELREKRRQADAAVHDIEAQLDALDPITRTAVMARVGADTARRNT